MAMNDEGWICLHRKSLVNGWLKNHKLWVFWCYCLLKASHKVYKVMIGNQQVTLQPGQFVFGRKKAAKETALSERSIRTCIDSLRNMQNVTIKTTNKFSLITIVNWEFYQDKGIKTTSKTTSNRPATDHIQQLNNKTKEICDIQSPSLSQEKNKLKGNGKDPRVKDLIDYFYTLVVTEKGFKPVIDSSDAKAVKRALKDISPEEVKNVIQFYIDSPKAKEHGLTLSIALSKHSINLYMEKGKWLYEG